MLVDINLLPQKEKKKSWALLFAVIVFAVLAVLAAMGWFYFQSLTEKTVNLEKQLAQNEQLRQTYENNAKTGETTPANELSHVVDWAQSNRKKTYVLLQHITSLLPERGFIQSFSFATAGKVTLSVQFDSTRQAADFLHYLQTSSYLKSSELQSISATEVEKAAKADSAQNKNELPRYVANYQLEIDLKALLAKDQSEEVSP